MRAVRVALSRLLDVFLRRQRDARLDEEIRDHLERHAADLIASGASPADAAVLARRAFGAPDRVKAAYRDERGWPWLDALVQDAGFAVRHLTRDRAFSLTTTLVLALGLGVAHLFFTLTYAHTMRGLPVPSRERLLDISTIDAHGTAGGLSYGEYVDLRQLRRSFEDLAAFSNAVVALGDDGRAPDRLDAAFAAAEGFPLASVTARLGRVFTPGDDRPGAPPTAVLTERVWRGRYDADANVLGRAILIDGAPATVIGVISDRSGYPSAAAIFLPLTAQPGRLSSPRDARTLRVFGRLAASAARHDAEADLAALAAHLAAIHPDSNTGVRLRGIPLNDRFVSPLQGWMPFLLAGLIVATVASANVGNLVLAGAMRRAREVAIRTALGASRSRIVRHVLLEGLLIAIGGAVLGLLCSLGGLRLYRAGVPEGVLPYWYDYSMDGTIFAMVWAMAFATVIIFGVAPALQASRTDVHAVLGAGGRGETGRRGARRWGTAFLALELGLAVVLIAQVGMATLNARRPLVSDAILRDPRVLTASIALPARAYPTPEARYAFRQRVAERFRSVPGVTAVSFASQLPLGGAAERRLDVAGEDAPSATAPTVRALDVAPGYFATLGLGLAKGRDFDERDGAPGAAHVIVNERLAALFVPGGDVLGRRIALTAPTATAPGDAWHTIVGVAPDIRQRDMPEAEPIVYLPARESSPPSMWVLARTAGEAGAATGALREALRQLDAHVPLFNARSLAAASRDQRWASRVSERFAITVCVAAFVLAVVGLYAIVTQRTLLRRREMALRMALGARPRNLAALVLSSVGEALTGGLLLGVCGAVAWDRAFAPTSAASYSGIALPATVAASVAALATVTVLACLVPARRVARLSPATVLREQ